jgi:hypothetical protein
MSELLAIQKSDMPSRGSRLDSWKQVEARLRNPQEHY